MRLEHPRVSGKELAKLLGAEWRRLSEAEKQEWKDRDTTRRGKRKKGGKGSVKKKGPRR